MNRNLFSWLPLSALLAGAVACSSKSSNNNDGAGGTTNSSGGSSSTGGSSTSGGSGGSGGSSGPTTTTTGAGGSGGTSVTTGALGGAAGAAGETTDGSDGGSAGASDGGAGGSGSGSGGSSSVTPGDACVGSDAEPNDDHESPTPYEVGTAFDACLQSVEDVDVYEFSIPEDDRGGVVTVSITEVGPNGDTNAALWAAADDGEFYETGTNTEGASVYFNFNAAPGTTFRLVVNGYLQVLEPNPYRLTIEYDEVADQHEPNQIRGQAAAIEVDEDVEGYLFAGWSNSTGVPAEDWYDWYSVELEAGETSILVDVMASDIDHEIVLYNPIGTQIASQGTNTEGSSVQLEHEVPEAGKYFVRVNPYIAPHTEDNSLDIPEYATTPYTLTVTQ